MPQASPCRRKHMWCVMCRTGPDVTTRRYGGPTRQSVEIVFGFGAAIEPDREKGGRGRLTSIVFTCRAFQFGIDSGFCPRSESATRSLIWPGKPAAQQGYIESKTSTGVVTWSRTYVTAIGAGRDPRLQCHGMRKVQKLRVTVPLG